MSIADIESDHTLEIDGPEGSMEAGFTMNSGMFIGYNPDEIGMLTSIQCNGYCFWLIF